MVGKPQEKTAITRPKRRRVSKINMHVKGTWWVGVYLFQDKGK